MIRSLRREKFLLVAESLAELSTPLLRLMGQLFDTEKSFEDFSRFLTAPARNLHTVGKQFHGLLSKATRQQLRKLSSTPDYKANCLLPLHPPEQADSGYFDKLSAEIAALLGPRPGVAHVLCRYVSHHGAAGRHGSALDGFHSGPQRGTYHPAV